MSSVSLGRMLTLFKPVYKSIDIRIACLREDSGRWRNVLTVVRFSNKDTPALQAALRKLVADFGLIDDERFRTVLEARPFGEWQTWNEQFTAGEVHVSGLAVLYDCKQNLEQLTGSLTPHGQYAEKEHEGNALEVYTSSNKMTEAILRSHTASAVRLGFNSIYEAVSSLLRAKFASGVTTDIVALAPALSRLQVITLDPNTGDVGIVTQIPMQLGGCQLNVLLKEASTGAYPWGSARSKKIIKLSAEEGTPTSEGMVKILKKVGIGSLQPQAWLDTRLVLEELELSQVWGPVEKYFSKRWLHVAPLFDVFQRFDSKHDLQDMLLKPQQLKVRMRGRMCKPDELFERSICWLLSFLGFSSIKMDEKERLQELATSVEIGSVDILAYHETEGIFLIANCSITEPSREKIQRMRNVAKTIGDGILKGTVRHLKVAYFTLDENLYTLKEEAAKQGVTVYERGDIERILNDFTQKGSTIGSVL